MRTEEVELIACKDGEVLDDRMRVGGAGGVVGWGVRAHEKLKNVKGKRFTVRNSWSYRFLTCILA